MTDGAIWYIRISLELYHNRIPYSTDGIICDISSILHLTAFTIYDAVLSLSLLACTLVWPVISMANLIVILHGHDQDIV